MPVSVTNSKLIYAALKACDVKIISALPETWLVHLIRMADEALVFRAKRERSEAVREFRQALALDPQFTPAREALDRLELDRKLHPTEGGEDF